jgi:hypothetical protein
MSILRQLGADTHLLAARLDAHARDLEARLERVKKRLELPQYLRQVATKRRSAACSRIACSR